MAEYLNITRNYEEGCSFQLHLDPTLKAILKDGSRHLLIFRFG